MAKSKIIGNSVYIQKLESSKPNHNAASFFVRALETKAWTAIKSACISRTYIRVEKIQRSFLIYGGGRSEATQMIKQEMLQLRRL